MISLVFSLVYWERVRMAQRQNDTVVKSTRCVTMAQRVTLAQRRNDTVRHLGTVCHFGTEGHFDTMTKCLSLNFIF